MFDGRCRKCESKFKHVGAFEELCGECEKSESTAILTPEQEELKAQIDFSRAELEQAKRAFQELTSKCEHVNVKSGSSVVCSVCGEHAYGWYCPKSPDKHCYYFTEIPEEDEEGTQEFEEFRFVRLRSGELFKLDAPTESESDDWCIFCGQPEERK